MSEIRKIKTGKTYFVTFTVIEWLEVFVHEEYSSILVNSIRFCQENKGLEVYSYVIMPNHVHMIASGGEKGNLGRILQDMKRHTSNTIVKTMEDSSPDRRQNYFLQRFYLAAEYSKRNKDHCFWRQTNHPIEIFYPKIFWEKETYIHMNPVKKGLAENPEDYLLSSASPESPIKVQRWKRPSVLPNEEMKNNKTALL
jgi:putative transposase